MAIEIKFEREGQKAQFLGPLSSLKGIFSFNFFFFSKRRQRWRVEPVAVVTGCGIASSRKEISVDGYYIVETYQMNIKILFDYVDTSLKKIINK